MNTTQKTILNLHTLTGLKKNAELKLENHTELFQYSYDDICVCCGNYIPDGRQVCNTCESKYKSSSKKIAVGTTIQFDY